MKTVFLLLEEIYFGRKFMIFQNGEIRDRFDGGYEEIL